MDCMTTVLVVREIVAREEQSLVGPPDERTSLIRLVARAPIDPCRLAAHRIGGKRLTSRLVEIANASSAILPTKRWTA